MTIATTNYFYYSCFDKIPYFTIKPLSKANKYSVKINKTKVVNFSGKCKLRQYIKNIQPELYPIYQSNLGYYLNSLNKLKDKNILPTKNNILLFIPKKTFQKIINLLHLLEPFTFGKLTLYRFTMFSNDWLFKKLVNIRIIHSDTNFFKSLMLDELNLYRDK